MDNPTKIMIRADGSINTAYYLARGRQLRSEEAHKLVKAAARTPNSAFANAKRWLSVALHLVLSPFVTRTAP